MDGSMPCGKTQVTVARRRRVNDSPNGTAEIGIGNRKL